MNSLSFATIKQLRDSLKKKEISTPELLDFFINRFAAYDGELGAALEIFDKE